MRQILLLFLNKWIHFFVIQEVPNKQFGAASLVKKG